MEEKLSTKQYVNLIKDAVELTFEEYRKNKKDISEYFKLVYDLLEELGENL